MGTQIIPRGKAARYAVNHPLLSSAGLKENWSYTCTIVLCRKGKLEVKFTFTFIFTFTYWFFTYVPTHPRHLSYRKTSFSIPWRKKSKSCCQSIWHKCLHLANILKSGWPRFCFCSL